jgi:hypothetical protein
MNKKNFSSAWAVATLLLFTTVSLAQTCIDPPPIGGTPCVGCAPVGWAVAQNSPDIISGNGAWPGGGYTVSDISGNSTSGGSMGLFLSQAGYVESWQTTLTGLTAGTTYQVAVEWQQATLSQIGGGTVWTGGQLRLTVDGNSTDYTSTGTVAGDTWQQAAKTFTAIGTTANLVLGHSPTNLFGMVVADSGSGCSIGPPPPPQAAATIPTTSEIALGAMSLLLAIWGVVVLRNRRRNPNQMV